MEEVNEVPNEGISSATYSKYKEAMKKASEISNAGISSSSCSQASSEEKPYPVTVTSQQTIKQLQDCLAKFSKAMEEANEILKVGISSATCSRDKGPSSNDQPFKWWMGIMSAEDMEVLKDKENRDICLAVSSGNVAKARSMLDQKPGLAKIKIQNGMLPIHLAASCGHQKMLQWLFDHTSLDDLEWEQTVQLFFTTIKNNMYGVALDMLNKCPRLADSRDEEQLTALHVLAQMQPKDSFHNRSQRIDEREVIEQLWKLTGSKEQNEMLEFISKPSAVLFDATKSGNFLILETLLKSNPELLMVLDSERRSLIHTAVLYRQAMPLYYYMIKHGMWKDLVIQAVDNEGNNILHMAGMVSPYQRFESSRPDILMQRELLWFEEVEKRVPTGFRYMRNKEGQTPKDIFYYTHSKFMIRAKHGMKDKANYGMLVATIITTIVFAASLTVPGHDVLPDTSSLILQKQPLFIVFFVSNSVALFSSSASIIFFLPVATFSYAEDKFSTSLLLRMSFGAIALFVALTTVVVAFTAACFLIFNQYSTWVAYLVASLSVSMVALSVFLLYTLFSDLFESLFWSRNLFHTRNHHFFDHPTRRKIKLHEVVLGSLTELAFKIYDKLARLCQNSEANERVQEDNPAVEP